MPKKYCPPNTICFDDDTIFNLFLIFLVSGFILYYLYNHTNISEKNVDIRKKENIIEKENIIINVDTDSRDLLEEPGRKYFKQGVPINIRTRGEPANYDQIGFLTSVSDPNNIKPLFGRQTYRGSSLWNYYTALDSHLSTKIPIQKNRNCIDTQGCSEINNGDVINISGSSDDYRVELYPYNELRYIPYV